MAKKKVFISWSGERSLKIAKRFGKLLQCTIQAIEPWHSDENLEKGTAWVSEIFKILKDTNIGIICLTKENKDNPWILFESGAIAKGLESSRVYTLLIDLKPTDIKLPLSNFNHTELSNKDSVYKLFKSINDQLEDEKLNPEILKSVFEVNWSSFEEDCTEIINSTENSTSSEKEQIRTDHDILLEILTTIRGLSKEGSTNYKSRSFSEEEVSYQDIVKRLWALSRRDRLEIFQLIRILDLSDETEAQILGDINTSKLQGESDI